MIEINSNLTRKYNKKYICLINNKRFEILSNLNQRKFYSALNKLKKISKNIRFFKIIDCIEFNYLSENGITLADIENYI